jgi:hypothetical protein
MKFDCYMSPYAAIPVKMGKRSPKAPNPDYGTS